MTTFTPINGSPVGVITPLDFMRAQVTGELTVNDIGTRFVAPWKSAEENEAESGAPLASVVIAQDCEVHGDVHYLIAADLSDETVNPETGAVIRIYGYIRPLDPEEEAQIPNGVDSAQ